MSIAASLARVREGDVGKRKIFNAIKISVESMSNEIIKIKKRKKCYFILVSIPFHIHLFCCCKV